MSTSDRVALLAPVPLEHLADGAAVCRKRGKVAFGSRAWEVFRELDLLRQGQPADVLIYASHAGVSGPPRVTWRAEYIGQVESRRGAHPDGMTYRPPSTAQYAGDNEGHWAVFWEVRGLRRLSDEELISIRDLTGFKAKSRYRAEFVPQGPILVLAI